jgi:exopolysaccharide biosynthesis polyprenyl glycosylphosphotransferase
VFWVVTRLTHIAAPSALRLITFWVVAIAMVATARASVRAGARRLPSYTQNTLIVGAGDVGQLIARKIQRHPEYGLNLVGFVDAHPKEVHPELDGLCVLGPPYLIREIVCAYGIDRAVLAFSGDPETWSLDLSFQLRSLGVHVDVVPRLFEMLGSELAQHSVEGLALLGLPPLALAHASRVKRVMDVVIAGTALVVTAPLLGIVALLVRLDSPGRVFYRSSRIGRGGRRFQLLKFRTMYAEFCRGSEYGNATAEAEFDMLMDNTELSQEFERTHKLHDDPRVTRLGRLLRRTSLDELPQLLNILSGDISLVGPRAITVEEYDDYMADDDDPPSGSRDWAGVRGYWQLSGLQPGLTGLWQINGRSAITYNERVRLDKLYLTNWSVRLDLLILAKTFRTLVKTSGAY